MSIDPFAIYASARSMCAGAERGSVASTPLHSRIVCSAFPCCRCSAAAPSCTPCRSARGVCAQIMTEVMPEARRRIAIRSRGTVRLYLRLSELRIGLIQQQNLAGANAVDRLLLPAGPLDLDAGKGCVAQPEIQTHVAVAEVTSVRIDFPQLGPAAAGHPHLRADPETIALAAAGAERDPMIAIAPIIAQQQRAPAGIAHHDVQVAVVVEIRHRQAAAHVLDAKRRTAFRRDVAKMAAAKVPVEQVSLTVRKARVEECHIIDHVSVGGIDVRITVVVEVEDLGAEGECLHAGW